MDDGLKEFTQPAAIFLWLRMRPNTYVACRLIIFENPLITHGLLSYSFLSFPRLFHFSAWFAVRVIVASSLFECPSLNRGEPFLSGLLVTRPRYFCRRSYLKYLRGQPGQEQGTAGSTSLLRVLSAADAHLVLPRHGHAWPN